VNLLCLALILTELHYCLVGPGRLYHDTQTDTSVTYLSWISRHVSKSLGDILSCQLLPANDIMLCSSSDANLKYFILT
jgi:hypothetical protein